MRPRPFLWLLGVCVLAPGCGPLYYVGRTTIVQPAQYSNVLEIAIEKVRNHRLAEAAWAEFAAASPGGPYSPDYADGFKEGYSDYLFAGGNGLPPPVPPRRYWKYYYQTTQGHTAIQDWYAGFEHGAAAARQSGYRELILVPPALLAGPGLVPEPGPHLPPAGPYPGLPDEATLHMPRIAEPVAPPRAP